MPFRLPNAVHETTTTSGTGPLTLLGAVTDRKTFGSQLSNGDTTMIVITDGTDWECAVGTFTSPSTISRDTVIYSTNGNALVNWPASGTRDVFIATAGEVFASLIDPTASAGLVVQTADRTYARRSIDVDTDYFSITNPAGTAGNPTLGSAYTVTAFIKTLLDDTDAISARSTLGLADGTQGYFLRAGASGPEYATPYFAVTAYRTTNMSIPNNTYIDLPFTSETHDSGSLHDTASNQELFVAPSWATKMRMTGVIRFNLSGVGVHGFRVVTSAGENLTPNHSVLMPGEHISVNISTGLLNVTGGSSYKIQAYQNSNTTLTIMGSSNETYVTVEFFP